MGKQNLFPWRLNLSGFTPLSNSISSDSISSLGVEYDLQHRATRDPTPKHPIAENESISIISTSPVISSRRPHTSPTPSLVWHLCPLVGLATLEYLALRVPTAVASRLQTRKRTRNPMIVPIQAASIETITPMLSLAIFAPCRTSKTPGTRRLFSPSETALRIPRRRRAQSETPGSQFLL
jgi:hypothetical protein